jgi:hypothetical protein
LLTQSRIFILFLVIVSSTFLYSSLAAGQTDAFDSRSDGPTSPQALNAAGLPPGSGVAKGMFILDPPYSDGDCTDLVSNCYSEHLVPTLICTGSGTPAGYNCKGKGAGEPYIKGAVFYIRWDFVNPSNGKYDFSSPDSRAKPWIAAGKMVAYDFIPTSEGSSSNPVSPAWYVKPAKISTVSQTAGVIVLQTTADMGFFPGGAQTAAGLEIQIKGTGTALDGNGTAASPGIWTVCDHTTTGCQDPTPQTVYAIGSGKDIAPVHVGSVGNPMYGATCRSGILPVEWRPNFIKAWKALMKQVVAHYGNNSNVAYLRFGFGIGGENIPNHGTKVTSCQAEMTKDGFTNVAAPWPAPSNSRWPQVSANWISYVKNMLGFEHSLSSPKIIATTISPIMSGPEDFSTANVTATNAVALSVGFGSQGLQKSDPINFAAGKPCLGGNWCDNFLKYKGKIPLELQTLLYSDPSDSNIVGSLSKTLPFATSLGTNILELYVDDWLCTFDTAWNGRNKYGACAAAGYPAAFVAAASLVN